MSETSHEQREPAFEERDEQIDDDETEAMEQSTHLAVFLEEGFYDD